MASKDDQLAALLTAITATKDELASAESIYSEFRSALKKMRLALWLGFLGLALMAVVITTVFILVVATIDQYNRIDANQKRISDNQITLEAVRCEFNTLVLALDTPVNYERAPDKKAHTDFFQPFYEQRATIGCEPPITPPVR